MLTNKIDQFITEDLLLEAAFYEKLNIVDFLRCIVPSFKMFPTGRSEDCNYLDNLTDDELLIELIRVKEDLPISCSNSLYENSFRDTKSLISSYISRWPNISNYCFFDSYYEERFLCYYTPDPWDVVNHTGPNEPIFIRMDQITLPFYEILDNLKESYNLNINRKKHIDQKSGKMREYPKATNAWISKSIGLLPAHLSEMLRSEGCKAPIRPVAVSHLCGMCIILESSIQDAFDAFHYCKTTNDLQDQGLIGNALVLCLEHNINTYDKFVDLAVKAWRLFHTQLPGYVRQNSYWKDHMIEAEEWIAKQIEESKATDLSELIAIKTRS